MWATFDPRYLTGPTSIVLGGVLVWIAARLWLVRPVNRVFRIGPFVTERGLRALLAMRPLFLIWGMFLSTQGTASVLYWFVTGEQAGHPMVALFGSLAAGFAVCSLALVVAGLWRLWRVK